MSTVRRIGRVAGLLMFTLTCLFTLYVLSIGPACKLKQRNALPRLVERAYWPLGRMTSHSAFCERALEKYQCWWLGVPYTKRQDRTASR